MGILREPLVHFLGLGALVFTLYAAVSDGEGSRDPKRITVTGSEIAQLQALWQKQWQRPPTREELRSLIEGHIRETVLYRSALALGLDQDDTILRRRLAQKMEFLIADVSLPAEPAEEELRAYFRENAERYLAPARVSFSHIYFSPDARGERVEIEARAALDTLRRLEADASHADGYGDRFALRSRYDDASLDAVARDFGRAFATAVGGLAPGRWQGPVASGYGVHLVYVSQVDPARAPGFDEVRRRVANDYLFDLRREANDAAYRQLRQGYEIVVEDGRGIAAGAPGG